MVAIHDYDKYMKKCIVKDCGYYLKSNFGVLHIQFHDAKNFLLLPYFALSDDISKYHWLAFATVWRMARNEEIFKFKTRSSKTQDPGLGTWSIPRNDAPTSLLYTLEDIFNCAKK